MSHTFKERVYRCPAGHGTRSEWRWDSDPLPRCQCGEELQIYVEPITRAPGVLADSIPGGLLVRHAICNADGTPKRYDSVSEIREAARKAGFSIYGETPKPSEHREV